MDPIFQTSLHNGTTLHIEGLSLLNELYIPEEHDNKAALSIAYKNNEYKYSDTCTINIILKKGSDDSKSEFLETFINKHDSYLDESHYDLPSDGWYVVYHIILPTIEWFQELLENNQSLLKDENRIIYFVDTAHNKLYKWKNLEILEPSDIHALACVNEPYANISRCELNIFSIGNLYRCFIKNCKKLFTFGNCNKCENESSSSSSKEQIFNRDFIWMTINIIKYHIELGEYNSAQAVLEELTTCGGTSKFCDDTDMNGNKSKSGGCGCNK